MLISTFPQAYVSIGSTSCLIRPPEVLISSGKQMDIQKLVYIYRTKGNRLMTSRLAFEYICPTYMQKHSNQYGS